MRTQEEVEVKRRLYKAQKANATVAENCIKIGVYEVLINFADWVLEDE